MPRSLLKPMLVKAGEPILEAILLSPEDVEQLLHWYESEYILVKEAAYKNSELKTQIKFSNYPFVKNKMPFVSSNLINLATDQSALIHIGMMIKWDNIRVQTLSNDGVERTLSFEEYNQIVGHEFVIAQLSAKYRKPILPSRMIEVSSRFLGMKKTHIGRYVFNFQMTGEEFFTIKAIVAYPLNFHAFRR